MKTATRGAPEFITATNDQRPILEDLLLSLDGDGETPSSSSRLIDRNGVVHDVPAPVFDLIRRAIPHLLRGESITVASREAELTTREAADLLNVSRQYVVHLCDRGAIPFAKTGAHRRIRHSDVVAYMQQRDSQRRLGLRRLTQLSEEFGLYDTAQSRPASAIG